MLNDEKRTVEEAYATATNTSDLTIRHSDLPIGSADIIAAAGMAMNQNRLGMALRRLVPQIDSRGRPKPIDGKELERIAAMLPPVVVGTKRSKKTGEVMQKMGPDVVQATRLANELYAQAFTRFVGQLDELPAVRLSLVAHVAKWSIPDAEETANRVLMWWLSSKCSACGGRGSRTYEGTNRDSGQLCRTCWGGGEREIPCGHNGRRIANYLDDCLSRGAQVIRDRLR